MSPPEGGDPGTPRREVEEPKPLWISTEDAPGSNAAQHHRRSHVLLTNGDSPKA